MIKKCLEGLLCFDREGVLKPRQGEKKLMFKRSVLSSAVSMAIVLVSQPVTAAQEDNKAAEVEIIEVKGIRGSLNKALGVKRHNEQIVDAIVAEDIGKFPDNNVVEVFATLDRCAGDKPSLQAKFRLSPFVV